MRKLMAVILSLILVCTAAAALAETKITVSGSGNTLVPADTAVISLGISARDRDVLKAQQKANETIAAIRAILTENGIAPEDINTGYMNIYAIYDYNDGAEEISSYNANSTLAIRVTDMEIIGQVIDLAFGAGANTLNGIDFSASDTADAEAAALKKAVADARTKAEILAEAAGLKITRIEVVSEGATYSYDSGANVFRSKEMAETEEDAAFGAPTVVQAAKLQVSATISVTFLAEETAETSGVTDLGNGTYEVSPGK